MHTCSKYSTLYRTSNAYAAPRRQTAAVYFLWKRWQYFLFGYSDSVAVRSLWVIGAACCAVGVLVFWSAKVREINVTYSITRAFWPRVPFCSFCENGRGWTRVLLSALNSHRKPMTIVFVFPNRCRRPGVVIVSQIRIFNNTRAKESNTMACV